MYAARVVEICESRADAGEKNRQHEQNSSGRVLTVEKNRKKDILLPSVDGHASVFYTNRNRMTGPFRYVYKHEEARRHGQNAAVSLVRADRKSFAKRMNHGQTCPWKSQNHIRYEFDDFVRNATGRHMERLLNTFQREAENWEIANELR